MPPVWPSFAPGVVDDEGAAEGVVEGEGVVDGESAAGPAEVCPPATLAPEDWVLCVTVEVGPAGVGVAVADGLPAGCG